MLPVHCTTSTGYRLDGYADDTPVVSATVLAAVPAGSTVAGSQAGFVRAVGEHPDAVVLRVDAVEHLRAVVWVLASTASWVDLTARPTWAVLMERTGLSRASVARWLAWLRERGLVGVVESGTTPRFAPMALAKDAGNRAALYVLCVPAPPVDVAVEAPTQPGPVVSVEKSETPTFLGFSFKKDPYPGARASRPGSGHVGPLRERKERSDEQGRPGWTRTAVARSRTERLALTERLRDCAPALRPLSAAALRSVLRPWLERPELGWTVAWLLHAIDHTPDGEQRIWTTGVRAPSGWLRFRLSAWLDEHGQPLPSPGVALAAAEQARREIEARARAERAERDQRAEAEQEFGRLVRQVAGRRYPALVQAVLARHPGAGRLMPATAAQALTRQAIRDRLDLSAGYLTTQPWGPVADVVDQLLNSA